MCTLASLIGLFLFSHSVFAQSSDKFPWHFLVEGLEEDPEDICQSEHPNDVAAYLQCVAEFKELSRELEQLESKNEALERENEAIERETEVLKKQGSIRISC